RPAEMNERVTQICLPPERYIVPDDTKCEIASSGETQGLRNLFLQAKCNFLKIRLVVHLSLLTSPLSNSVLQKDYGGPLACKTDNSWVLEGVIIPMRCCGHPQQPNTFICVSVYVDWIKKVMT
ncbi:HGFL protein, partial [Polyodon spathula]|nr:HGFL protein [Polyodon spathula]